MLDTGSYSR
jgi:hypothetical protein